MISDKAVVEKIKLSPYQSALSTNYFQKLNHEKKAKKKTN